MSLKPWLPKTFGGWAGPVRPCSRVGRSASLGYAWAAGWIGEMWAVEASATHCRLGAGTLGASATLGAWMLS